MRTGNVWHKDIYKKRNKHIKVIDENSDELINQNPFYSRSAKLFPFPNRLNNGRYQFNNQTALGHLNL